eukprot:2142139-Heterocapsa_arctica.AAC.1
MVHVAYEWPRGAYSNARRVPSMRRLLNVLPHSCMFDGCMYGLQSDVGYLRKPWRVQTYDE